MTKNNVEVIKEVINIFLLSKEINILKPLTNLLMIPNLKVFLINNFL